MESAWHHCDVPLTYATLDMKSAVRIGGAQRDHAAEAGCEWGIAAETLQFFKQVRVVLGIGCLFPSESCRAHAGSFTEHVHFEPAVVRQCPQPRRLGNGAGFDDRVVSE